MNTKRIRDKEQMAVWSRKSYERTKHRRPSQQVEWNKKNPEKRILFASRSRARKVGLEHTLSLEDIIIPEVCPYLEIPLVCNHGGNGYNENSPSVDRIDNSKGYIPGNVEIISRKANTMKSNATIDELLYFAYNIIKKYGNLL